MKRNARVKAEQPKKEFPLALMCRDETKQERAEALAVRLGVPIAGSEEEADRAELILLLGEDGISLTDREEMNLRGDFSRLVPRIRPEKLAGEMLIKAAKLRDCEHPTLLDATAGLGEDSFLLAAAGFTVTLCERDPVIAALLSDALERAENDPGLSRIAARMTLCEEDSIGVMRRLGTPPDVILLDPMFPERQKSGLIKKKFQLLQKLESPCDAERELLEAAIAARPRRIVIKRPLKAEPLAGVSPNYSISGKAIRYDCILPDPKKVPLFQG